MPLGAIFRGVNIVEYKSPTVRLSIEDYHKAGAYARLYSVRERIPTTDITITFVVARYPKKVLNYLQKTYGYQVKEMWPGIYYIEGDIFRIQIIESGKIREEDGGGWLKNLRGGLNGELLREIIERGKRMPKGSPLSAYLYMVLQANVPGAKELAAMSEAALETA
ncbi:MAG: hypothetical protein LBF63_02345, partial [Treponema sp.]|nr:hypothetical protein [Treponema sp.]